MKDNPLYVPIMLHALAVGQSNTQVADLAAHYEILDSSPLGAEIIQNPFTTANLPTGVHLHWTMPDALLRGRQGGENRLEFPRLPNRWIVQRIGCANTVPSWQAWMIESDHYTFDEPMVQYDPGVDPRDCMYKTTFPAFRYSEENGVWVGAGDDGGAYCCVGSARILGKPPPQNGGYLDSLTAVGPGDPMFAAYYQRCATIFGFYDNMCGVPDGSYTYLVAGYYESERHDPLYAYSKTAAAELGWEVIDEGAGQPSGSLLHGSLTGLKWSGKKAAYVSGAPAGDVQAGFANTSVEAVSMLAQQKVPDKTNLERLLNILQYGALKDLDNNSNPDALINAEEFLHAKQFSAADTGVHWQLKKIDDDLDQTPVSEDTAIWLGRINVLQQKLDELMGREDAMQQEIYLSWCKYVSICLGPEAITKGGETVALDGVTSDDYLKYTDELLEQLSGIKWKIDRVTRWLGRYLGDADMIEGLRRNNLRLEKAKAAAGYIANEPVIILSGEGVQRAFKQGFQTAENGLLPCRVHTIAGLSVTVNNTRAAISAADVLQSLSNVVGETLSFLPNPVKGILAEAVMLSPDLTEYLTKVVSAKTGCAQEALLPQIKELQSKRHMYSGTQPYYPIAVLNWKQPWAPLVMVWEVQVTPLRSDARTLSYDNSFTRFSLDEIDFKRKQSFSYGKPVYHAGSSLLSPHAAIHMKEMLEKLIKDYGEEGKNYDDLKKALNAVAKLDVLTQRMEGFADAMISRKKIPSVPFSVIYSESLKTVRTMTKLMRGVTTSPSIILDDSENSFLPLRASFMNLSELWLVDSFGQIKNAIQKDKRTDIPVISASESLKSDSDKYSALLRPRFPRACAVRFQWLWHKNERVKSVDENTTPIFGYFVPNFLDGCLHVYDESACLIGFIAATNTGVKWMKARGGGVESPEQIQSVHLRLFVASILANRAALGDLLSYLDRCYNHINTASNNPFMQLCFGNVVALARARVNIVARGCTPYVQQWQMGNNSLDYDRQQFEINIGDYRKLHDGFIGFYPGEAAEQTYGKLYCMPVDAIDESEYLVPPATIKTRLADKPVSMTILFDPTRDITIRTGFLPVIDVRMEALYYRTKLEKMETMFRAMPLLTQYEPFEAYVPAGMDDAWTFAYTDHQSEMKEIAKIQHPSVLPPLTRPRSIEGFMKLK